MLFTRHKKGQLKASMGIGLVGGLLVLALVLGLSMSLLSAFKDTQQPIIAGVTNESFNASLSNTFVQLSSPAIQGGSVTVFNSTSGVVAASNYTIDFLSGRINVSHPTFKNRFLNISYSSSTQSISQNASQKGMQGLDQLSDFQPTIAVVAVASVLMTLLIGGVVILSRGM